MKKLRKPLSLLLALVMISGIIAAAPFAVNAAQTKIIKGTFTVVTFDGTDPGTLDYYYSDSYFSTSGKETNPHLRTMSAALAFTTYGTSETPEETYGKMLTEVGFSDVATYDMDNISMDTMGVVIAHKNIDGREVVAVALRGDHYGVEMAANLIAGAQGDIKAFYDAEQLVESRVSGYLEQHNITSAKYWVVGYSRGGAVANLFGRELNKNTERFGTSGDDIYVYTIEPAISSADGTAYENIHNIIDLRDLVTWVYPAVWSMYNSGTPEYIGDTEETIPLKGFDFFSDSHISVVGEVKISDFLKDLIDFMGTNISRETYSAKLQEPASNIVKMLFALDSTQLENLKTYFKAVFDSMMADEDFLTVVVGALVAPTAATSVDSVANFLKQHMDKVAEQYGKPVDDESYAYIQSVLNPIVEVLLPFAYADFTATHETADGETQNVPLYHVLTLAGNLMDLIKHHFNYNVFDELTAMDSYYHQDELIGDANKDGYITVSDATVIQRYSIELPVDGEFSNKLADVNNDGYVTITDATCVQRYVAQMTVKTGNAGIAYREITPASADPQIIS